MLGLLIGALIIAGLHFLVNAKMKQKKLAIQAQIATLEKELKTNDALVAAAPRYAEDYRRLSRRIVQIGERELVPEENTTRWGTNLIEKIANRHGLAVNKFSTGGTGMVDTQKKTPKGTIVVPSPFQELRINIDMNGDYHQLGRFLADLETALPSARLDSLGISPKGRHREDGLRIAVHYGFLRFSATGFPPENRPGADAENASPREATE